MDQFYIEEGYYEGKYFVYVAEAYIAIGDYIDTGYIDADYFTQSGSRFSVVCDAEILTGQVVEANGAFTSAFTQASLIERSRSFSLAASLVFTQTTTVTRIISVSVECGALFSPSIVADAFKNHTAILDVVFTVNTVGVANRAVTMAVDAQANLNAQAAKTVDAISAFNSTATQLAQVSKLVDISSTLQTQSTLAVDALSVQLAQANLVTSSSIYTTRYFGTPRPRDLIDVQGSTFSSSVVKFGSHSATGRGDLTAISERAKGNIPDADQEFVFETWFYKGSNTARTLVNWTTLSPTTNAFFTLSYLISNVVRLRLNYGTNGTVNIDSGQIASDTWNHLLIVKNNSLVSFYVNGTRVGTFDWTYDGGTLWTWTGRGAGFVSMIVNANNHYLDETSLHLGTTLGYSPSSTTITVPTTARVNDPATTAFLYHFNGNNSDDILVSQTGQAALASQFSVSASAQELSSAQAALATTATVSAQVTVNKSAQSQLSSSSTVSATATRIQLADSAQAATFSQTAQAVKTATIESSLNVFATVVSQGDRTRTVDIAITSAFTPTLTADVFKNMTAILDSVSTLTAQATTTVDSASAFASAASLSSDLTRIRTVDTAISSVASLAATVFRIQDNQAAITATATLSVVVGQEQQAEAAISSASTLTADAVKTATGAATASTAFTQAASVERTRSTLVAVNSEFAQVALAVKINPGSAAFTATASLSALAVKTTEITVTASTEFAQSTVANRTANALTEFNSIATQLTVAFQNASGTVLLESTASLAAIIGAIKSFDTSAVSGVQMFKPNWVQYTNSITQGLGSNTLISFWARKLGSTSGRFIWNRERTFEIIPPIDPPFGNINYNRYEHTYGFQDKTTFFFGGYNETGPQGNASIVLTISNVIPDDDNWHHYGIFWQKFVPSADTTGYALRLYIDGSQVGSQTASSLPANQRITGTWYSPLDLGYDTQVEMAQLAVWGNAGNFVSNDYTTLDTDIYNAGYVELGSSGTVNGNTPYIYDRLDSPYSANVRGVLNYTLSDPRNESYYTLTDANQADLPLQGIIARTNLVCNVSGVFLFELPISAEFSTSILGQRVRTADAALICTSTLASQAQVQASLAATLNAEATLGSVNVDRFRAGAATLASTASITVEQGFLQVAAALLTSTATLTCEPTEIEAIQGAAALTSTATLAADVNNIIFMQATASSEFTVTAEATLIPPVRADASLTAAFSLVINAGGVYGSISLVASAGTLTADISVIRGASAQLTAQATQTAQPTKRTGIAPTTLQVAGFVLTTGDIINFEPSLTYYVPEETRTLFVLPESRALEIEQETRQLTLLEG